MTNNEKLREELIDYIAKRSSGLDIIDIANRSASDTQELVLDFINDRLQKEKELNYLRLCKIAEFYHRGERKRQLKCKCGCLDHAIQTLYGGNSSPFSKEEFARRVVDFSIDEDAYLEDIPQGLFKISGGQK